MEEGEGEREGGRRGGEREGGRRGGEREGWRRGRVKGREGGGGG